MEKGEDMNTIRWKMPDQYLTEWYRNLSGAGTGYCGRLYDCSDLVVR